MKKNTFWILFLSFVCTTNFAQLAYVGQCAGSTLGTTSYGPMYSTTTANSNNRTIVIYPASQLAALAGQNLNVVYFNRFGPTQNFPMVGTPNFKIYFKLSTAADLGAAALDWVTEIASATLVYDANPTTIVGSTAGWKSFPLLNNFAFPSTAQSLIVYMEYSNPTAQTASINWNYEFNAPCVVTTNSNTTKYNNNTTGTLASALTSTNYRRPGIAFDYVASCNAPLSSFVNVTSITGTTATLNWTAPAIAPAIGYEYFYSTSSTPPTAASVPTGTTAAGITSAALTGLSTSSAYNVWIRSACSATEKSVWTSVYNFATLCIPVNSFPWTENFDALSTVGTTNFPLCWLKENGDWSTSNAVTYNLPRSGANYLRCAWNAVNEYVWTQSFNLTAGTSYDFSYWTQGDGGTGWTSDTFVSSTQLSTPTAPTQLGATYSYPGTGTLTTTLPYVKILNVFTPTTTGTYYFAVRVNQPTSVPYYVAFDDFRLEPTPSCIAPSAVVNNTVTNSGATISWTAPANAPANGYQYFVSTTNTAPLTTASPTGTVASGTSVLLNTLTTGTTYFVWVRSACSASETSPWSDATSFNATLPPACATATAPVDAAVNVPAGSYIFGWTAVPTAVSYDIFTGSTATTATTLVGNFTTNSAPLVLNSYSTTIYWKVVPKNAGGLANGCPVWSFTTQAPPGFCLAAPGGLYPSATYTVPVCDGTSVNTIAADCYAGEFSNVNLVGGNTYSFRSSITTDFITISADGGYSAVASGVTPVSYTPTANSIVRFYTHKDNQCVNEESDRARRIVCTQSLDNKIFNNDGFSLYPNPVSNMLNIEYSDKISFVRIYNLVGQEVLSKQIDATQTQLDMTNLSSGTYLVKINSNDLVKTVKINKY